MSLLIKWGFFASASAIVLSNDVPAIWKSVARKAKWVWGDRIQVCDGVDDQVEIQAAIDALPSSGGKVMLLEGFFNISTPLKPSRDQVFIQGMGRGVTTIYLADGSNCNMIENPDETRRVLILQHLTLNGNRAGNTSGNGILLDYLYSLGTVATPSLGVEIKFCAESGIRCTTPYCEIYAEYIFIRSNVGHGIWVQTIQGSLMRAIYSAGNGITGISAAFGDSIVELFLEGNTEWGAIISPCHSILKIWSKSNHWGGVWFGGRDSLLDIWTGNNCLGVLPQRMAEVFMRDAYRNTLTLKIEEPGVANVHGIYLERDVSENAIRGHIQATGYAVYFSSGAGWNPDGLIIADCVLAGTLGAFNEEPPATARIYDRHSDLFMDVLAEDDDKVVAAEDISGGGDITCTLDGQPDVPRNLTLKVTDGDASISAFTITATGVDAKGNTITEVFVFADGLIQTGSKAFATVSSVEITDLAGAGAGDLVDVGIGSKLGLSNVIYETGDVYKCTKNGADYSGAGNITPNVTYNTVDVSTGGAIVVDDDFRILYKSNLNIIA